MIISENKVYSVEAKEKSVTKTTEKIYFKDGKKEVLQNHGVNGIMYGYIILLNHRVR